MNLKPFSTAEGITYQQEDLKRWQTVLKPEVFQKLKEFAEGGNEQATDGYRVLRGNDFTEFVCNFHCKSVDDCTHIL